MNRQLKRTPVMRRGKHTAYDVLKFVSKVIKDEPRRLYMGDWLTLFKGQVKSYAAYDNIKHKRKPECGTVACIAGWIGVATRQNPGHIFGSASAIDALNLRNSWPGVREELYTLFMSTNLSTPEVLHMLNSLIRKYKNTLQATTVVID